MAKSHLDFFKAAVEKDPTNTFARYSLAMEYRKAELPEDALAAFEAIVEHDPDYVAAYLMAGQLAADIQQDDRAIAILNAGIERARAVGNDHAASEMSDLLEELE